MGAPLDAPSFRIVSGYSSDDLDDLGLNNADVLKRAIDGLIFTQVNVVSVADVAGSEVPEVTRIVVADPSVIEGVEQTYGPLFGEIEVVAAEVVIEGVDIEVTLGKSYLGELGGSNAAGVAGSEDDA
jgi:hypothetical protein